MSSKLSEERLAPAQSAKPGSKVRDSSSPLSTEDLTKFDRESSSLQFATMPQLPAGTAKTAPIDSLPSLQALRARLAVLGGKNGAASEDHAQLIKRIDRKAPSDGLLPRYVYEWPKLERELTVYFKTHDPGNSGTIVMDGVLQALALEANRSLGGLHSVGVIEFLYRRQIKPVWGEYLSARDAVGFGLEEIVARQVQAEKTGKKLHYIDALAGALERMRDEGKRAAPPRSNTFSIDPHTDAYFTLEEKLSHLLSGVMPGPWRGPQPDQVLMKREEQPAKRRSLEALMDVLNQDLARYCDEATPRHRKFAERGAEAFRLFVEGEGVDTIWRKCNFSNINAMLVELDRITLKLREYNKGQQDAPIIALQFGDNRRHRQGYLARYSEAIAAARQNNANENSSGQAWRARFRAERGEGAFREHQKGLWHARKEEYIRTHGGGDVGAKAWKEFRQQQRLRDLEKIIKKHGGIEKWREYNRNREKARRNRLQSKEALEQRKGEES